MKNISLYTVIAVMSTLFFSPTYAQQKESFKAKNTTIQYQISKETTDQDLEVIKKEVNQEKIAVLEFSGIKRNNNGEIIALNTKFKDERGSSQSKSEYNSVGINTFNVAIHENEHGYKYLQITPGNSTQMTSVHTQQNTSAPINISQAMQDGNTLSPDFMELMQAMQADMQRQQDMMEQMMMQITNSNTQQQTVEPIKKKENKK